MKNYTVFYEAKNYNPYRIYSQNFNRYTRCKSFETEQEALNFAKQQEKSKVYYLGIRI